MQRLSRRQVMRFSMAGSAWLLAGPATTREINAQDLDALDLGVASGEPSPHSVILWTRVPSGFHRQGGVDVFYEIATDPSFPAAKIVARGTISTGDRDDWTVKVKVESLRPGTTYHYRFRSSSGYESLVGRTRTLAENPEQLQFAVVCCQSFFAGYYTAFHHLAQESPDFIIHLGDHIYEKNRSTYVRKIVRRDPIGAQGEAKTLTDYRAKYKLYLADPESVRLRQLFPFFHLWDDHEVMNDYSGTFFPSADVARQIYGYQAFGEYLPVPFGGSLKTSPLLPQAYRSVSAGALAHFVLLDERQYRSRAACSSNYLSPGCNDMRLPGRTMLGEAQKGWLKNELASTPARWRFILSEVVTMPYRLNLELSLQDTWLHRGLSLWQPAERFINLDGWESYPQERQDIVDFLRREKLANVVILSGDVHNFMAGDVRQDMQTNRGEKVAYEVVTSSISSYGFGDLFGAGADPYLRRLAHRSNPQLEFCNYTSHGYTRIKVQKDRLDFAFIAVHSTEMQESGSFVLWEKTIAAKDLG